MMRRKRISANWINHGPIRENDEGLQEAVNMSTGGDSICYLVLNTQQNPPSAYVVHRGKYPLFHAWAEVIDNDKGLEWTLKLQSVGTDLDKLSAFSSQMIADTTEYLQIGDLEPNFPSRQVRIKTAYLKGDHRNITVFFTARNGSWIETYSLRLVKDRWLQAIQVVPQRGNIKKLLYKSIDQGYPEEPKQQKK